jgi:hypothetical protein
MMHRPNTIEAEAGARLLADTVLLLRQRLEKHWPAAVQ